MNSVVHLSWRSVYFVVSFLTTTLISLTYAYGQEVPEPVTTPTTPTTIEATTTTAPATTGTPTSTEVPQTPPATEETVPRNRRTTTTPKPTFVPPTGNPSAPAPDVPGSGPLHDAGTRYLPLMVFLSIAGFTTAAAVMATQWYRSRPAP